MVQPLMGRHRLGIIILILLVAFPAVSSALCRATLRWDANDPIPDGYMVFGREEGRPYDYDNPWWQGDDSFIQCTIDQLEEDRTYYFVVRAYVGSDTSGDSNEVRFNFANGDSTSSLSNDGSVSVSGSSGGGSGAGCFIRSLFGSQD